MLYIDIYSNDEADIYLMSVGTFESMEDVATFIKEISSEPSHYRCSVLPLFTPNQAKLFMDV